MARPEVADILYMPAVHRGYEQYLNRREGMVGLLGEAIIGEIPRLDRDIRAISAPLMKRLVRVLVPGRQVFVLNDMGEVGEFLEHTGSIIMPDEDVSHTFSDNHLSGVNVTFESVFLRWDRKWATKEATVDEDTIISRDEFDAYLMNLAVVESTKSPDWWRQIGCLIVINGQVVLQGYNQPYPVGDYTLGTFGDPRSNFEAGENIELQKCIHSEVSLIAQAAKNGIALEGAELVVSTFPCPVCARSIAQAGIKRVLFKDGYSLLDAQDVFKAKGVELVRVDTSSNQPA